MAIASMAMDADPGEATAPPSRRAGPGHAPGAPSLPADPLRFVLRFMSRFRWWYASIVALEIGSSLSGILSPYAIRNVVATVSGPMTQSFDALFTPLALLASLGVLEVVLGRASGACRLYVAPLQRTGVTADLYAYLNHHSQHYIGSHFAGALASRISETSLGVNLSIWTVIFDFLPIAVTLIVAVILLAQVDAALATFTFVWAALFVAVSYLLARRCQTHARAHAAARSDTTGKIVDAVTNLSSIRFFTRLDFERRKLDGSLQREIGTFRKSMGYNERILWFQGSAAAVLKVGLVAICLVLWSRGRLGVAEVVMSISISLLVVAEGRNLSRRFLDFFEYLGNIENGVRTIVRPHDVVDRPGAPPLALGSGRIEFRDVHFEYEPGAPVFRGLSVTIAAGERVGLVGYSGSGKSTLVNLMLRQYDPQRGQILIDGADISNVTQESLHAQIGLIPQDPGLFHRSLLDNIRYGRLEAGFEEVEHAARVAHAHDFIRDMAERYESLVGERGVKLSGGQRQRIAIARVVLKNAPILIMDEATSSLDSVTEKAIQDTMETVMQGKTVIVVAHRLSTIAHLDRILVFEHGAIVEDGSHAGLLAQRGLYHRLWSHQSDGFLESARTTG